MASTMASTLPMAAIFTRNKMIGWVAVVFAIQSWLAESPEQAKTSSTPAYFQVGMSGKSPATLRYFCRHLQAVPEWLPGQRHRLQHLPLE
ncbi:hypothetical protein SNOG_00387 [Parastagonospora nodorum SN15]|uniref:Uncharacterized protein n=1 Tax=Phaeosphaeria nodorum (strain SN15 / ATCC MYA-4574 / FGSC 10173) TaxID=321614 RepID=Q0V6H7_PHANO|nr:hypothetical protein SNOG_00387 [Parastagonospora nodorum SN15]EAT91882.2 hypothetical protein SNOG_00387 [Parastagonospora nodorum SN15]